MNPVPPANATAAVAAVPVRLYTPAFGSAALKATQMGLMLVLTAVLARALGPHGYGIYTLALALVAVLAIPGQMGLPTLLVREVSRYFAREDFAHLRGLLRWATRTAVGVSVALSGALLALCAVMNARGGGALWLVLAWGAGLVPLFALAAVRSGTLRGLRRVVAGQLPELAVRPATLLAAVALWLVLAGSISPAQVMALHVLAAGVAWTAGALLLRRVLPVPTSTAAPAYESRRWWTSLAPLSLLAGVQVLASQLSILLLGALADPAQVGLYRVAHQGAMLVTFGLLALNMAAAPELARLSAAGRRDDLQSLALRTARAATLVALPLAAVFWAWGDVLLTVAFGAPYAAAYAVLAVLCAGQVVNASAGSVGTLMNMLGHERATVRAVGLCTVGGGVIQALLIPRYGALGAAIGSALGVAGWNLLLCRQALERTGLQCGVWSRARGTG